jgi:iron(III) transport system ATP-binding protein
MEIFAETSAGETLKAVARPDPAVIGLAAGSDIVLTAGRGDLLFFEDTPTGRRLS